jgi:hypothetical protein
MVLHGIRVATAGTLIWGTLVAGIPQSPAQESAKTVKVRVSVTDPLNRFVADLQQQQFKLTADGKPQTLTYFAHKSASIGAVCVIDTGISDQMAADSARKMLANMQQTGTRPNELVLISFDRRSAQVETIAGENSQAKAAEPLPQTGVSSLTAAVRLGLDRIKSLQSE